MEDTMPASAPHVQTSEPAELGAPAFRVFFRIAEAWKLTPEQQMKLLGLTSRSTYYKWRKEPPRQLSPDLLERLSYLFGIYKNLQVLLPDAQLADEWVRRPNTNPLFGGSSPLERMLSGLVADLYVVRSYLDAERGGWY
jgi:uncharacterized protein (DUF2384 family)